jgi:hypothetical protein
MTLPPSGAGARLSWPGAAVSLLGIGAALLILAARLHCVAKVGSPVPLWDEWDPDIISIVLPPADGLPGLKAMLAAHNGHRIVLSRLLYLALFWLQGRHWEVLSGVVLDQVAFSFLAGGLLVWLGWDRSVRSFVLLVGGGAALCANPFGWQAQDWALESSIYFCIVLSVAGFCLLASTGPARPSFWCGIGLACLSVLSFGAGIATVLAAFVLVALRDVAGPRRSRAVAALMVLGAAAAALLAGTEPVGMQMRHQVGDMIWVALRVLSWPLGPDSFALAYLPVLLLVGRGLVWPALRDRMVWFAGAVGVWEAALAAQLALARFDDPITSRYTEFLVVGLVVNLAVALRLWQTDWVAARLWRRAGAGAAVLLWCGAMASGFYDRAPELAKEYAGKRGDADRHAVQVARYLKTGDAALLYVPRSIPYHTPDRLGAMLRQGAASGIFEPVLWQGDTPARDHWRKTLSRWATRIAVVGGLFILAALLRQRRPVSKVFWFFFSKKNMLSSR